MSGMDMYEQRIQIIINSKFFFKFVYETYIELHSKAYVKTILLRFQSQAFKS